MTSTNNSNGLTLLLKYFHDLSDQQQNQFGQLQELYEYWNARINVISRKDIHNLYLHHVLHSLSIARWTSFSDGSLILDLGSGGGFPAIPLAILFPRVQFIAVDSIGKKLKVIQNISDSLGLVNASVMHDRMENVKVKADFVVCRAVAHIHKLQTWTSGNYLKKQINAVPNGLIALKGGLISEEIASLDDSEICEVIPINRYFKEAFFEEKYIIYCPMV